MTREAKQRQAGKKRVKAGKKTKVRACAIGMAWTMHECARGVDEVCWLSYVADGKG